MSEANFYNPLLDDDDETERATAAARPTATSTPKAASKRAVSEQPRQGTPREVVTEKDAVLLAFLGKFRVATADTLAMLLKAEGFPGTAATGVCTSIDQTQRRLRKLERLGLIEHDRYWTGGYIYGLRKRGLGAAIDFGYLYGPREANKIGLSGLNYSELPHDLAISSVAARFASEAEMMGGLSRIPLDNLVSEYTLRAATRPHEVRLARAMKQDNPSDYGLSTNPEYYHWGDFRAKRLIELIDDAVLNGTEWADSLSNEPELWTLGHPSKTTKSFGRQKHFPDLVVTREGERKADKPASIFVEVELSPKPNSTYETIMSTYAEEFKRGLYMGCYYATNSVEVENAITKADKKLGLGLVGKRIRFIPITTRDGSLAKAGKRIGE